MSLYDEESGIKNVQTTNSISKSGRLYKLVALGAVVLTAVAALSSGKLSQMNSMIPSRKLESVSRSLREDLVIGCIDNNISTEEREQRIGAKCGAVVKYQSVRGLDYQWIVKPTLDSGRDLVMVLEFMSDAYANLGEITGGGYDDDLNKFIDSVLADGNRQFWLRFMHEFNGDWYPWGTYRNGNSPEKFKEAYRHVVNVFRARGANVKFQLSYNCENPRDDPKPMIDWFPGEDYTDMILCSAYNRAGVDSYHTKYESFATVFQRGYDQMSSLPGGKPLGVAETGTTSWGGDKPQWIRDAFAALDGQFGRVKQADFFMINKEGDWDMNSDEERRVFGEMVNTYGGRGY